MKCKHALLFLGHIFPIGFKCVRQEHDALLDKVVDIKCEIEALPDDTKQNNTTHNNHNNNNTHTNTHRNIVPLFRVTVAWEINNEQVVRVYEARSPQQAWQAAVLEKIGIETSSNSTTENDGNGGDSVVVKIDGNNHEMDDKMDGDNDRDGDVDGDDKDKEDRKKGKEKEVEKEKELMKMKIKEERDKERNSVYEDEDDEERQLRAEIRDQRRSFFRALRVEQRYA